MPRVHSNIIFIARYYFLGSFNVQREFVGNIVMPGTRAVLQDRLNNRNIIMQQVIRVVKDEAKTSNIVGGVK